VVDTPTLAILLFPRAHFETLRHDVTRLIFKTMQFSDFFNAGNGLMDTVKTVLFRMLPRRAQIEKVRVEINNGLLKRYGKMTRLEIDKENKVISTDLELKGENLSIQMKLSNYRLIQEEGKNPLFEAGTIEASREWLNTLLQTLVKTGVIPERIEIKNPLQQTVVKSLL